VRLRDQRTNTDREILIKMNSPLRYRGETFFQARFAPISPAHPWETTILQVVDNPGWILPYVACLIGAAGMVVHFGIALVTFLRKRFAPASQAVTAPAPGRPAPRMPQRATPALGGGGPWGWAVPAGIALVCLMYVTSAAMRSDKPRAPYDLQTFASLPITHAGRVQPVDSLAINSLRILSGKSVARVDGTGDGDIDDFGDRKVPAIQWLADVFAGNDAAFAYQVFRIDHPDIKALLDLKFEQKYFSANEIMLLDKTPEQRDARVRKIEEHATPAARMKKNERDGYQQKLAELAQHLNLFAQLRQWHTLHVVPPVKAGDEWLTLVSAVQRIRQSGGAMPETARGFAAALDAYEREDSAAFNREVASYRGMLTSAIGKETGKAGFEVFFNRFAPFYVCMVLYVIVFVLACLSWLGWTGPLWRAAFAVLLITLAVHSFGLIARMYISGRPPVTNLYSSAVFVAWGTVVLAMFLEVVFRNGLGMVTASVSGFLSLLIAHHLSGDGDTMEMLQAVLDTNIWLATHVVIINLGYAAAVLAAMLGILYVIAGVFTTVLTPEFGKALARMIYGSVCFAILLSFVGTILGGIWADQSWGRFWGWDPKENGAAMVVLWNAVILHARWGGLVRERGLACLAIFGNCIIAWSWFGTNMLGVGLHSYGFMESAVFWLITFIGSQLLLIGIGLIPTRLWRSAAVQAQSRSRGGEKQIALNASTASAV
jgi:ABC-type transport system involved in cytochrome c biogenesis permease subunit